MRLALWIVLCCISCECQIPPDTAGETGRLEVVVLDSFGQAVTGAKIELERVDGSQRRSVPQFRSDTALQYGTYMVTVSLSGFSTDVHTVEIASIFQVLMVGLKPAEVEGRAVYSVRGRMAHPERYLGCRIVRLVPLLSSGRPIQAVMHEGGFVLDGVWPGRYTAAILGPTGICGTADVVIPLSPSREIVIGDGAALR